MRLAAMLAAAVVVLPAAARADLVVAAEYDFVGADSTPKGAVPGTLDLSGTGPGVRAGWALGLPLLRLEPEVGLSVYSLDPGNCPAAVRCGSVSLTRAFAGARAALGTGLTPGALVRASYGWAKAEGADSRTGTLLEAGAFLDFRFLPVVEAGLHATAGKPSFDDDVISGTFWSAGAHVALIL